MMSEEYTENGRVSDNDREESPDEPVPTPDINSPRHSVTAPPVGVVTLNGEKRESSIEFFGQKGGVSESGSEEGEGEEGSSSPRTPQDRDNTSFHSRPYVTVSVSPGEAGGRVWSWLLRNILVFRGVNILMCQSITIGIHAGIKM